jgi:hypothetical protein
MLARAMWEDTSSKNGLVVQIVRRIIRDVSWISLDKSG